MHNLYQSKLRKDIQHEIYRNPTFTVEFFGKEYFWTIKTKKIWPFTTQRYQIMGVQLPDDKEYVHREISKLKKHYTWKWILFQLGIVNEMISFENSENKCEEFREDMKEIRIGLQNCLHSDYSLKTAFRENMPTAWITYDVTKSDEELLKDMNESCRKRVKKSIAAWLEYQIVGEHQYEEFFIKRKQTADTKWFNTISKAQYERLIEYIDKGKGMLIWAFFEGRMIAGTICLFTDKMIYCPYGFFDRKYSNIGVQHFLKFKLFSRARENWFKLVDTGGWAPTGFPKHSLASVSMFKESLGGTKSELYGSYNIVLNKFLYRAFRLRYKIRG